MLSHPDFAERSNLSIAGGTLSDLLRTRRITINEALTWATEIAQQLTALHERGQIHGAVAADRVAFAGKQAILTPAAVVPESVSQPQDIAQFAALLRQMLDSVQIHSDAARAQWNALDRIATTNAQAASGSRMNKVAWAIKLVRPARRAEVLRPRVPPTQLEAPARVAAPAPGPVACEPISKPRTQRLLMLPAVPPREGDSEEGYRTTYEAKNVHVWAFLASAATIALIGCILFVRLKW
jgi:hypothetical protein